MRVACIHDAGLEQSVVPVNTHEGLDDEDDEAEVVFPCLSWSMEQDTRVGSQRPVVVLTRSVDAVERFLVQQHLEAVLVSHTLHERHEQHVVVHGEVSLLEDRRALKLVRRHLVVTCLHGDAELKGLDLQVFHEGLHTLRDRPEVVVVHLLVLGALMAHQRTACENEVRTCGIEILVDEEILLLPAEVGDDLLHVGIEIVAYIGSSDIHGMQCSQQRSLVVERLARIRDEDGRDTERVVHDEDGACRIPR